MGKTITKKPAASSVRVESGVSLRCSKEDMESEANRFAIELIMPEEFVLREIKGGINLFDENAIQALARKFKVTPYMMAARIGELMERKAN